VKTSNFTTSKVFYIIQFTFTLARFQVDKRRLELERLERRIFPIGRTLVHQDSASSLEGVPSATDESTVKMTAHLEQVFERLKAVTGTDQFCCL
jgi:hypothetical protein